MGLFDNAFNDMTPSKNLSPPEAFVGILLSAVAADGHISDEEAHGLNTITSRMRLFEPIDGQKYCRIVDRLLGLLKRSGVDELLSKSAAALPSELAETAFASACDLVLADQGIEDEEKEYLAKLRNHLQVSREQAQKIFKVMVIKNRG